MKSKIQNPKSKNIKMFLILDPGTVAGSLRFIVVRQDGKKVIFSIVKRKRKSIELVLARIAKALHAKKYRFQDFAGVCVAQGGESFSAVRGMYAIANAIAWSLQIPVCSLTDCAEVSIRNAMLRCLRAKRFHVLLPHYSREPNITVA
ncbi:hypothetical protein A3I42_00830 [Candidatus Uhrbacteria bacterium RIFCSPLOWO2_02_FULL_49_11]|uniref:Gcp-like domain-containing protein n=1 Tax=Candidatus Uhrbacteria bacterium RIFCSPLOWO2_02_FULL_49_11 TaxID=1802409 RepID=A0A1F7VCX9_9BACT|nr:MAG: hypothetical protein A3I42_00830 [Candidatus Uhrbacteria bacterium RIFCSPLOWO2_02_FULL_49_11]